MGTTNPGPAPQDTLQTLMRPSSAAAASSSSTGRAALSIPSPASGSSPSALATPGSSGSRSVKVSRQQLPSLEVNRVSHQAQR